MVKISDSAKAGDKVTVTAVTTDGKKYTCEIEVK